MNYRHHLIILFLCFALQSSAQIYRFEQTPSWVEEFNTPGLPDNSVWGFEDSKEKTTLQRYAGRRKENSYISHGKLNIVLRKERYKDMDYTSARMFSKQIFNCGKFVFRAKYPIAKGTWTNIWLKSYKPVGQSGEIDIVEYFSKWGREKFQFNLHVKGKFDGEENKRKMLHNYPKIDVSKWHVYTLEWYPDHFVIYVDGKKQCDVNKNNLPIWPFNDNGYRLFLNVHCGGQGGAPDDSKLPQTLQVDWIRYYKLIEEG